MFAWAHVQARVHGVFRAAHQLVGCFSEGHPYYFIKNSRHVNPSCPGGQPWTVAPIGSGETRSNRGLATGTNRRSSQCFPAFTRNEGICPPPLVTLANPVALSLVKNPANFPRNRYGAKSTSMFL